MSFSLRMILLFIFSHIIMDGLPKFIYFSIWFLNFFFDDLVLVEDQLILISYERVRLK